MEYRGCFSQLLCCWGESTSQPELTSFTSLPKHREIKHVIFRAMYDFKAIEEDDLSFSQGDLLKKENPGDTSAWVVCINMRNGNKGFVPIEYVQLADTSSIVADWWFDCSRSQAEALLMRYEVAIGSFLVRESLCQNHSVLSMKYLQDAGGTQCVFHYKIRHTDGGERFISRRKIFPDLFSLVAHYREHQDGLKCRLTVPCRRLPPIIHLRTVKVTRGSISLSDTLAEDVWRGTLHGKLDIAAKKMTRRNNIDNEYNMVSTMKALRHVRLVQLLAVCVDFEPMLLIMEYMSNGSLHDFLRATASPNLEFNMAKNMCGQIAEGMAFLESKSYIHGDLRSANILIGEHHTVKISYAWQGKEDTQDCVDGENRYPTKWMAPEAALYNKQSIKSDVWSFGVLMYEIASSGIIPYTPIVNLHKVFREIEEGYRLPKPTTHWPPEQLDRYYDIIQQCWKHDPSDRPSFVHVQEQLDDL